MFEPPILNQLMGVGGLLLGFVGAGILAHQLEQQELEERRLQEEQDTQNVIDFNKILEMGREIERQQIRKNIRRPFPGFTYDNEKPEGLEPERLALPEPRRVHYANRMG
jgi:hypothetical protein